MKTSTYIQDEIAKIDKSLTSDATKKHFPHLIKGLEQSKSKLLADLKTTLADEKSKADADAQSAEKKKQEQKDEVKALKVKTKTSVKKAIHDVQESTRIRNKAESKNKEVQDKLAQKIKDDLDKQFKADEVRKKEEDQSKKRIEQQDNIQKKQQIREIKSTTGRVPASQKAAMIPSTKNARKKHNRVTKHKLKHPMMRGVKDFNKNRPQLNINRDKGRTALPPGWRMGPSGPYYEGRPDHSDKYERYKLRNGGGLWLSGADTEIISELMQFTDMDPALQKERDRIYQRYYNDIEIPAAAFRPLLAKAIPAYKEFYKDYPEALNEIDNLTEDQRDNYTQLFASDFDAWKSDHEQMKKGGNMYCCGGLMYRHGGELYETGATSHAVNDLILFTDNTRELAEIKDQIFKNHVEEKGISTEDLKPLLEAAKAQYKKEFPDPDDHKHINDMTADQDFEFLTLYTLDFINLLDELGLIMKSGGFFDKVGDYTKSAWDKTKSATKKGYHKTKEFAGYTAEKTKKGYHVTKKAINDKIDAEREKIAINYLKQRAGRKSLSKNEKDTLLEARHIIVKNYCGGGYLYRDGGELFETGATSHPVNDLILFADNTRELAELRDKIFTENRGEDTISPYVLVPLLHAAKAQYKREFRSDPDSYKHISDMTSMQDNEFLALYTLEFNDWLDENYPEDQMRRGGKMTPYKKRKMEKVFREYGAGKLKSSSGHKVRSHKQAIAIALSEAGLSRKPEMKHGAGFSNAYSVSIDYQDTNGNPQTKTYNVVSESEDDAIKVGEAKVKSLKNFMKIQGGNAFLRRHGGEMVNSEEATRQLIDKLTDIGIDIDEEEEAIIAEIRLELEDAINDPIEVNKIVTEFERDWPDKFSERQTKRDITKALLEFREIVPNLKN